MLLCAKIWSFLCPPLKFISTRALLNSGKQFANLEIATDGTSKKEEYFS